jgi:membrane protein DedA with SNARE-associated domain
LAVELVRWVVEHFTYLGIFSALLAAALGVPIPEEVPIIAAGVLVHEELARWWIVLPVCILGVLCGDVVLYWSGRHWGEQVLHWRIVRLVLSPERAARLTAAYRRHAVKTIFTVRHVMVLRAAAFLTAGIAHVPFWKFLAADATAALLGVPISFGLAYFFTDQLKEVTADMHRVQRWLGLLAVIVIAAGLAVVIRRRSRKVIPAEP